MSEPSAETVLGRFSEPTRTWFTGAFPAPTAAQLGAWDAVSSGAHALVIAPTGSGKTLSAFLWALDSFVRDPSAAAPGSAAAPVTATDTEDTPRASTRVLYISPLKALGVDVERNLRSPLIGITQTAKRLGLEAPEVRVGVRSGDTPAAERRRLVQDPPDILITTPESLYLMLTSQARSALTGVETVIVDEVHAVAGTKRGAHLAISLERLDALLPRPVQRIGLSATVEPASEVARFLGGIQPVTVVRPASTKKWDLTVTVPVPDLSDIGPAPSDPDGPGGSLWPHIEERIVELVASHRSTIVFANSRRQAERLTGRLNEIWELRQHPAEDPDDGAPTSGASARYPAQIGGAAGVGRASPTAEDADDDARVITDFARAHHGSVSKEQRAIVEDALKTGQIRCVVATSSLELGIDMGAVDLVIQVASPPSVASALQRVGRAGHQVGEVSAGVFFPQHRADLVDTAVVSERMRAGRIEALQVPTHPLDILAQQTVAAVSIEDLDDQAWFEVVRRAAPYSALPQSAYESVLDLLAGRYPSDEFAELRPRLLWDREQGTLAGRPGAQRLAVTSGGTIPDRGLFGVFLATDSAAGSDGEGNDAAPATGSARTGGRRVGELDEEMVYESRVGDVILLGATSWQIVDITADRVLVLPAYGQPGKLPFWRGDAAGRPAELGEAVGRFRRDVHTGATDASTSEETAQRLQDAGLDEDAAENLRRYLADQHAAVGVIPSEQTLVVERFTDELGDWRVVLHSPYGMGVHAPWALAVGARLHQRYGIDTSSGAAMAADDGIVLRIPLMDGDPPGAELFEFAAEELDAIVTAEVGSSALFAARFRENAARSLLLPRRNPGKRTPLWQQRQRSAQLLDVARKHPRFPVILETVREVLQDVYDLPALKDVATKIAGRRVRIAEVTTQTPSPFAQSLLFGYVAQFIYEGDSPLAERRAAALSLDPALLSELLGADELRELLDPDVIAAVEADAQRLSEQRRLTGAEGLADLLRLVGPLSITEAQRRVTDPEAVNQHVTALEATGRVFRVRLGGQERIAAVEDAARLRDALGAPIPHGVPVAFLEPVDDPLGDLVSRYARTHGPFTAAEAATALGLGAAVVLPVLQRLASARRITAGAFRPDGVPGASGVDAEWCEVEILRRIRRRSLSALRAEVEPVDQSAYARFLADWQHLKPRARRRDGEFRGSATLEGVDGVATVLDQLAGSPLPASAWESLILPTRVRDYTPAMLDELLSSGEYVWSGTAATSGTDGWVALHPAATADLTLRPPEPELSSLQQHVLDVLGSGGAWFFGALVERVRDRVVHEHAEQDTPTPPRAPQVLEALWQLVWQGRVGNDTFAPVRGLLSGGKTAHKTQPRRPRARTARLGGARLTRERLLRDRAAGLEAGGGLSGVGGGLGGGLARTSAAETGGLSAAEQARAAGRWSLLPSPESDTTLRAHAAAEVLLDRYGVITRGSVVAEDVPGGFARQYQLLTRMEESGQVRRGHFVDRLGGAQFSTGAVVDQLRGFQREKEQDSPTDSVTALALAATDPANPYGAALDWPEVPAGEAGVSGTGHRPGRKAGAVVVLTGGELTLYLERGGRTLLAFTDESERLTAAAHALVWALRRARTERLALEKLNGAPILGTPLAAALLEAGFYSSPSGLRYRN
ncbi:MAG: ATP-dependent helicase [Micrococcus sp.]|nr:ATP-dependent helicase [Micrococcus sp.]